MSLFSRISYFNPTLVQLESSTGLEFLTKNLDFNPTLVQLEYKPACVRGNACRHFNPTLVQLEWYLQNVRARNAKIISIPHWCN